MTKFSVVMRREDDKLLEKLKAEATKRFPGVPMSNSDIVRLGMWSLKTEWGVK